MTSLDHVHILTVEEHNENKCPASVKKSFVICRHNGHVLTQARPRWYHAPFSDVITVRLWRHAVTRQQAVCFLSASLVRPQQSCRSEPGFQRRAGEAERKDWCSAGDGRWRQENVDVAQWAECYAWNWNRWRPPSWWVECFLQFSLFWKALAASTWV